MTENKDYPYRILPGMTCRQKLEVLANHLEKGKLGHKNFDFYFFNSGPQSTVKGVHNCGTAGCALGEMPFLSDEWEFNERVGLRYKTKNNCWRSFFGISIEALDHLFFPNKQDIEHFGGRNLGGLATRYDVAANIRSFLEVYRFPDEEGGRG